jgi:hypothetical protein
LSTPCPLSDSFEYIIGSTIKGVSKGERFGQAIDLSDDGSVMAVGSFLYSVGRTNMGSASVYERSANSVEGWAQRGQTLYGEAAQEYFGTSVALSSDGSVLVVGAYGYRSGGLAGAGRAVVYDWNPTSLTWSLRNSPGASHLIAGSRVGERAGYSVDVSSNGNVVVVGSVGGTQGAAARAFSWSGVAWIQLGAEFVGTVSSSGAGTSVSISSDGLAVAIGAPNYASPDGTQATPRVFDWNEEAGAWAKRPNVDIPLASRYNYGYVVNPVSISSDGTVVATGSFSESSRMKGVVTVHRWSNGAWARVGDPIKGLVGSTFGAGVRISADASTLVIGAKSDSAVKSGEAAAASSYAWDESTSAWKELNGYAGEASLTPGIAFGVGTAVSADGSFLVVGAWGETSYKGAVYAYKRPCQ